MVLPKSMTPLALSVFLMTSLQAQERTTVGGYGEVHYVNSSGPGTPGQVNLARFVTYLAHTFSEQIGRAYV